MTSLNQTYSSGLQAYTARRNVGGHGLVIMGDQAAGARSPTSIYLVDHSTGSKVAGWERLVLTKEGMRAVCASGEAASIDLGIGGALSNRVTIVVAALAQEIGRHHQSVCVSADGNFSAPATDLNWLKLAELRPVGRTVLVGLLRGINDLIQTESFHQLNLVLSSINVSDATSQALLAIARYSAPARAKLSEWRPFVDKVRLELGRRGEDTETLMTGLPG